MAGVYKFTNTYELWIRLITWSWVFQPGTTFSVVEPCGMVSDWHQRPWNTLSLSHPANKAQRHLMPYFFSKVEPFTFTEHSIKTPLSQKIRLLCITAAVSFSLMLLIASFGQWQLSRPINQLSYLITSRCTSRLLARVVFEPSRTHHSRYGSGTAS